MNHQEPTPSKTTRGTSKVKAGSNAMLFTFAAVVFAIIAFPGSLYFFLVKGYGLGVSITCGALAGFFAYPVVSFIFGLCVLGLRRIQKKQGSRNHHPTKEFDEHWKEKTRDNGRWLDDQLGLI